MCSSWMFTSGLGTLAPALFYSQWREIGIFIGPDSSWWHRSLKLVREIVLYENLSVDSEGNLGSVDQVLVSSCLKSGEMNITPSVYELEKNENIKVFIFVSSLSKIHTFHLCSRLLNRCLQNLCSSRLQVTKTWVQTWAFFAVVIFNVVTYTHAQYM